ncbi:MAG: aminotransferase class V-fold PLP-dependent enzyme [Bacilli bacterium]|nr:aminotransferase class V-fold PLP-dependent enzyme [Bacilli bacterium]
MIYLDNAATTFPKPNEVLDALDKANRNAFNTGRGSYKVAANGSVLIENVREKIRKISNMKDADVIFTSSATQSLNDIILGLNYNKGDNIYISPFEHNSIIRALEVVKNKYELNVLTIPFNTESWIPDYNMLENMFAINRPKAIFISHISNVTGLILPYKNIFSLGKKYNSINLLDSSQAFGVVEVENNSNIDFLVFAGHKSLYASFGIAGFVKKNTVELNKFIFGGNGSDTMNPNMPDNGHMAYEAGSPNIVAISGLNASIDWLQKTKVYEKELDATHYLINSLKQLNNVKLYLPEDYENKIFGVVSIGIDKYSADEVGSILNDEFDIAVRTGFHCAPLVHDFIGSKMYNGTVRISLNYFNTFEDIDYLISALKTL